MAKALASFSLLMLAIGASLGAYVHHPNAYWYYLSETEITVNIEGYHRACYALPSVAWPVYIEDASRNDFLFESYAGSEGYLICVIGPRDDGQFCAAYWQRCEHYRRFQNKKSSQKWSLRDCIYRLPAQLVEGGATDGAADHEVHLYHPRPLFYETLRL